MSIRNRDHHTLSEADREPVTPELRSQLTTTMKWVDWGWKSLSGSRTAPNRPSLQSFRLLKAMTFFLMVAQQDALSVTGKRRMRYALENMTGSCTGYYSVSLLK